jgi:YbbR domain-containing protein
MDWRGMLIENWPYKLAALVLAILLWFNVAAERRQEHPVPTRLEVQVRDPNWVITEMPDRVRTTFQGRGGDIFSLPMNPPVIRRVIDSVTGPIMTLDLSPAMVSYDRDLKIDPVAVHPSQVDVHLERRTSRKVAVAPRLVLSAASGFAVVRPIRLQPDSVTVHGPRSALASIDSLLTERVVMEDLGQSVTEELRLEPPGGIPGLRVEPATVLATVEVDSLVEASLTVPLRATGPGASGSSLARDSVAVVVRGPKEVVRGLDRSQVQAFVVVDSVAAGAVSVPVQVTLPKGVQATGTPSPAAVTVTPRKAGG